MSRRCGCTHGMTAIDASPRSSANVLCVTCAQLLLHHACHIHKKWVRNAASHHTPHPHTHTPNTHTLTPTIHTHEDRTTTRNKPDAAICLWKTCDQTKAQACGAATQIVLRGVDVQRCTCTAQTTTNQHHDEHSRPSSSGRWLARWVHVHLLEQHSMGCGCRCPTQLLQPALAQRITLKSGCGDTQVPQS